MAGLSEQEIRQLVEREASRIADERVASALRERGPRGLSHDELTARLKGTRHENSDHLDRALNVLKLKPEAGKGSLVVSDGTGGDVKWSAVPASNGCVLTSDTTQTGGVTWKQGAGSYVASMYAANSGAPTHTNLGGYQKVGSGGGTLTWTSLIDKRPSGVSAQVDTATNKRIDVRKTGLYQVIGRVAFNSIADAKTAGCSVWVNGANIGLTSISTGGAASNPVLNVNDVVSLTAGDYVELYAYQDDSASEAYIVSVTHLCSLKISYLGEAS